MQITNFGANVTFQPGSRFAPESDQEVLAILGQCRGRRIRVVGRLHSWSEAARGDDVLLDLRHLNDVRISERDDAVWATIGAGCQIKKAVADLERRAGVTLPSLGLITEQTIAGATATGTHGSGKHSLSHYVDELRIATYDADTGEPIIRTVDSGDELLAARCSLGCLGVVLSISLRCRKQYAVEEHFRMYKGLDEVLAAEEEYPLQQFFLVPWLWKFLAQHRRESSTRTSLLAPLFHLYWFCGIDVGLHLVVLVLAKVLRARWTTKLFFRHIAPLTVPRRWKVVDKSQRMLTMELELFRHIEIEVFVRRSDLAEALQFVRELLEYSSGTEAAISPPTWDRLRQHSLADAVSELLGSYTHHYPICVRKVLPDETLISMTSGGDEPSYAVSLISYHRPQQRTEFFALANVLAQTTACLFNARPHWGKVCPIDGQLAEELYLNLPDFRQVCDEFDRAGVFRNAWVDEVLFQ